MIKRLSRFLASPQGSQERKNVDEERRDEFAPSVQQLQPEKPKTLPRVSDLAEKAREASFLKLRGGQDGDSLESAGVMEMLSVLKIGEADIAMLILLYRFGCASLLDITKQEFINGLSKLGVKDVSDLRPKIPSIVDEVIGNDKEFSVFFKYVFQACREGTVKSIPKSSAIYLLPICFSKFDAKMNRYVESFCQFLDTSKESEWNMKSSHQGRGN